MSWSFGNATQERDRLRDARRAGRSRPNMPGQSRPKTQRGGEAVRGATQERDRLRDARRAGRSRPQETGMTLLELVVAMSVFAVIMLGLVATLASGLTLTRNNRNRSVAANLASQEMDLVRSATFASLVAQTSTQSVGGVPYVVHRELTWVADSATNGPCDGTNGSPQMLRVHVWVDWPSRQGVATVKADTVLTPPVGAYDPNTGHIAVKVLDRSAAPQDNIMVLLTGPTARSAPTNSDGCAFFGFLPPGAYSVSLNTTQFVDRQGVQNPTQSVNVTVGQVNSTQFDYDQRATLHLDLDAGGGGVVPNDVPVTLGNTILVPTGARTYTGSGTSRTVNNLFPASDGYDAWAGSCADADPEGLDGTGNAFYPSAQRDAPFEATPNATTDGSITLNPLAIHVVNSVGVPQANQSIVLVHGADNGCAAGETHTVGTTNATGDVVVELPFGNWQMTVQGRTVSGSWPSRIVSPLESLPRPTVTATVQ